MYVRPRPDILFGDIFEAPYLFDVALHEDATRLASAEFPRFDLPGRALLLSDDCHIPTARGDRPDRSDRGRDRLLFAIVAAASPEEITVARERVSCNRFPLPADDLLPEGGIAELQRLFTVRARDLRPHHRIAALDDGGRRALEVRWNGFAARRGPESSLQNANKLALLLAGEDDPTPDDAAAGLSVWELLDFAWDIEGTTMRGVSEAYERGDGRVEATDRVVEDLRALALLAGQAADLIEARGRRAAASAE